MRLSVVIPAYREAERIASTVARVREALSGIAAPADSEIVIVDDGSRDGTARRARDAGADVVIEFSSNAGKGAAVRAGIAAASGAVVAFTDADLAYAPEQFAGLLEAIEQGADLAVGNRRHSDSVAVADASMTRRLGSAAVYVLLRALGLAHFGDTQCGLKAFSRPAARRLMEKSIMNRFAFDVEVLHLAHRLGMRVREIPVTVRNHEVSSVRVVSDGSRLALDMLRIRVRDLRGRYDHRGGARLGGGPRR